MSGYSNKIAIIGRLGKDPEILQKGGNAFVKLTVGTSESIDGGGGRVLYTEWHRVVVWGKQAKIVAKHLHEGSRVYVDGELQTLTYDDKNGNHHYLSEIIAWDVVFDKRLDVMYGKGNNQQGDETQHTENEIPF